MEHCLISRLSEHARGSKTAEREYLTSCDEFKHATDIYNNPPVQSDLTCGTKLMTVNEKHREIQADK